RVAVESQYDERDVALYNLGIGANEKDLEYIYEGDDAFEAIPTFGVLPMIDAMHQFPLDFLPNFEPAKLLHGEQSLRILGPIPTRGKLVSNAQLIECLDKGKAVSVVLKTTTKTSAANPGGEKVLFENVSTLFIRGSGGFGGQRHSTRSDESTATNRPPARKPDAIMFHTTSANQAALYRLSGDYNPLHVDPEFAEMGGFSKASHRRCFCVIFVLLVVRGNTVQMLTDWLFPL
ncbi:Thioesterase/thiol ester dehydrase-isomerase, partial [Acaromyces ingoldii]